MGATIVWIGDTISALNDVNELINIILEKIIK